MATSCPNELRVVRYISRIFRKQKDDLYLNRYIIIVHVCLRLANDYGDSLLKAKKEEDLLQKTMND